MTDVDIKKFEKEILKGDGDQCWHWLGPAGGNQNMRYGYFGKIRAHRLSYEIYIGPIPDGMFVCHKCDIPMCVRPDHLFLGTAKDNSDDMVKKGRQFSKISEKDAYSIKKLSRGRVFSAKVLAGMYGLSVSEIKNIASGRRWSHVSYITDDNREV